jgi:hypothetical protein
MKITKAIYERVKRLRYNMLVHSYLYYRLDSPVISDDEWQRKADELVELQRNYGTKWDIYDDVFEDWDGGTGMHLPGDQNVRDKAMMLLDILAK